MLIQGINIRMRRQTTPSIPAGGRSSPTWPKRAPPNTEMGFFGSVPTEVKALNRCGGPSVVRVIDFDLVIQSWKSSHGNPTTVLGVFGHTIYRNYDIYFFCVSSIAPQFWRRRRAASRILTLGEVNDPHRLVNNSHNTGWTVHTQISVRKVLSMTGIQSALLGNNAAAAESAGSNVRKCRSRERSLS